MAFHVVRMIAAVGFLVFCTFYPYLPGEFDGLAVALSVMAQACGLVGMAVVAVGLPWLVHEVRRPAASDRSHRSRSYRYAVASVIAGSLVALTASLAASTSGRAFGLVTLGLWGYTVWRCVPALRRLKHAEPDGFNAVPLYLVVVPTTTFLVQLLFAGPAMEFGRNRAIAQSAELIDSLERYHGARGRYPRSLSGLWPDYKTSVVGIEQFHYAATDSAYSLFFELPVLLVRSPGTREIVMYNEMDEHLMLSHASWNLTAPERPASAQGWYAAHDASRPHWKYFWFD